MLWDLFCRVIDNYGDAGVCWRLAADLASRGHAVRLWIDDPAPLQWMAPAGAPGVAVQPWPQSGGATPGDVVIEAFGCELPPAFLAAMAARSPAPRWVNLEYLSAEDYVERSHGLPSPQMSGPGAGLEKRFFYPGFTPRTGGLLREPGLLEQQAGFDGAAWLHRLGLAPRAGEQVVSLFCYAGAPLPALLAAWAERPTLLLATPGAASEALGQALKAVPQPGTVLARGALRVGWLPALPQTEFDRLLWASDLNFVRGEDSFVRAQWAGKPFVWHIYPQDDDAHVAKLLAFLRRYLDGAPAPLAAEVRAAWYFWNGLGDTAPAGSAPAAWQTHSERWREALLAQADLSAQLIGFVSETH
ncbi:elongation factor P maturation arginine rhamnosyltransferase EarP [Caldimonas brevitalea]|nr:elongation factor P maturation arginine rhamnosyltransferase EarP [Caldimonas brevitalea]